MTYWCLQVLSQIRKADKNRKWIITQFDLRESGTPGQIRGQDPDSQLRHLIPLRAALYEGDASQLTENVKTRRFLGPYTPNSSCRHLYQKP
jgi:hypothetical protein